MGVNHKSHENFNEIFLSGALNLSCIPTLTPYFSSFFQATTIKDIVLNLNDVTGIDSTIIRLFLNVYKKLSDRNRSLYIMNPSEIVRELLSTTNLSKVIPVIKDLSEITEKTGSSTEFTSYFYPEQELYRLRCSCGVCGSQQVIGYYLDLHTLNWSWKTNEFIPVCTEATGDFFDYFGLQPVVCTECFMCGISPGIFNLIDKNNYVVFRSTIDDKTKALHAKSIGKRRKLVETISDNNSFTHPRSKAQICLLYKLADTCARTTAVYKILSEPFYTGYINFILSQISEPDLKKEYVANCVEWLNLALQEKKWKNNTQLSQLYYFLFVSNLLTGKEQGIASSYTHLSEMIESLPAQSDIVDINSPHFWFQKCKALWAEQIDQKSLELVR